MAFTRFERHGVGDLVEGDDYALTMPLLCLVYALTRFERHGVGDLVEGDDYAINYGEIIGKDSGTYSLTAENEAGTARVEGTVVVNGEYYRWC